MMEEYGLENSDYVLSYAHSEFRCAHRSMCPIHKLTDHPMRSFPQHWRADRGLMERTCPHGIGHPDPDAWEYYLEVGGLARVVSEFTHGCDGCCRGSYPDLSEYYKGLKMHEILQEVVEERARQEVLHPNSTCANPELHSDSKFCILAEEVGEIAKSLNDGDHENLREELIQVAAVCVAWIEAIDRKMS
jgi:NTP pyrophosphatase (non-canonical NTP hydrolase)